MLNKKYEILFFLMSIVIIVIGYYNGVLSETGSQDLQYFPSKLFRQGIDFYNHSLSSVEWFLSQRPNYYHHLYFLLYPFTILEWDNFKLFWFTLNICLFSFFIYRLKNDFDYSFKDLTLLMIPFFLGFPLTNTLGNGQFGIIVIFLTYFSYSFRNNKIILPVLLSLLMMKYSFGIPIVLGFFLMGYYVPVIISGLITIIFPVVYSFIFNLDVINTIFLPYKVSSVSTSIGSSDIMSISRFLYDDIQPFVWIFIIVFILILSFYSFTKRISKESILVCSILISFFSFFHMSYDWVVLILLYPLIKDERVKTFFYFFTMTIFLIPRIFKIFSIFNFVELEYYSQISSSIYYIILVFSFFILFFLLELTTSVKRLK